MKRQLVDKVETEITVRFAETDPYGIANNADYYVWFEVGRFDYAAKVGKKIDDMFSDDIVSATLYCECKYLRSCKLGDVLIIKTSMIPHKMYCSYEFRQKLYNKKTGELMATCKAKLAEMNMKTWRMYQWEDFEIASTSFKEYGEKREEEIHQFFTEEGLELHDFANKRLVEQEMVRRSLKRKQSERGESEESVAGSELGNARSGDSRPADDPPVEPADNPHRPVADDAVGSAKIADAAGGADL
jgi:acyl-CoA thioester hydrolase